MERQLSPGTVECGLIIYSGWPSPSCTLAVGLMLNPDFFFFLPFSLLVVEVSIASPFRSREQDNTPIPLRRGKIGRSLQGSCSSKDNGILRVRKLLIRHPLLVSFPLRNSVHATHSITALSQGLWPHNQTRVSVYLFVRRLTHLVEYIPDQKTISLFFLISRTVACKIISFRIERIHPQIPLRWHSWLASFY